MEYIGLVRSYKRVSQRHLARKAGVSYKAIQLIEAGHDARLFTLNKIAEGLGYPRDEFLKYAERFFSALPSAVSVTGSCMAQERGKNWRIHFFDFVDAFRRNPREELILRPPTVSLKPPLMVLLTSTVETLCDEAGLSHPFWCTGVEPLAQPWFPSETENLKAMALIESPVHFRKRNIFVLKNFLERV